MKRTFISMLFALLTLFLGVGLPYVGISSGGRFVNLVWSSVYGVGLWSLDRLVILRNQSPLALVGVIVWPLVVSGVLFIFANKVQQAGHAWLRLISGCILCATILCVVSVQKSLEPPFSQAPTFYRLFSSIW